MIRIIIIIISFIPILTILEEFEILNPKTMLLYIF